VKIPATLEDSFVMAKKPFGRRALAQSVLNTLALFAFFVGLPFFLLSVTQPHTQGAVQSAADRKSDSQMKKSDRHQVSPSPIPSIPEQLAVVTGTCKEALHDSLHLRTRCGEGKYQSAVITCGNNTRFTIGTKRSCEPYAVWKSQADKICQKQNTCVANTPDETSPTAGVTRSAGLSPTLSE
jgi:hypothetical protein